MFEPLLILSLLLLAVVSWYAGTRYGRRKVEGQDRSRELAQHYFQGINFLLNEQPDQAIDTFIRSVEVTPVTLETHLALGNLMRQKGEMERATRVHQNLLSRPNLSHQQLCQARLELGRDFLKAGVFDRAERLFLELVEDESGELRQASLFHLVHIYRHEQEWEKAIRAADMIDRKRFGRDRDSLAVEQAHFCCELAVQAMAENDLLQARRHLKSALKFNRDSARASILWGDLAMRAENYSEALRRYCAVPEQQLDYLPEVLESVRRCYLELGDREGFLRQLRGWLQRYHGASLLRVASEEIAAQEGAGQAQVFLADYLRQRPSLKGMRTLLRVSGQTGEDGDQYIQLLRDTLDALIDGAPTYRCIHCGFKGAQLHWLCPQCERWETVRPVKGVQGE